jgi:lipopolysaccharide export system permease protein
VFKKLDKLILKAFIGPFVATFFITVFVFIMQFFWKYIDDLVGKGLDMLTIMKLTGYGSITFMVLALPLAILISSIMTFGNLGESFELVAIRSSGIPLLRFMQPLIITTMVIAIASFSLANYVVPVANLKFVNQLWDIRMAKPAFDIREGVFYDKLTNYAIKVGKKDKNGTGIYDVVIYENDFRMQDNIIVAEKGNMSISDDKKFMEFHLQNGWRYQERGGYSTRETDFIRIRFKDYKKVFDLSGFGVAKTPDSAFKTGGNMLNIRQLQKGSDSITSLIQKNIPQRYEREISSYLSSGKLLDSGWKYEKLAIPDSVKSYYMQVPDSALSSSYSRFVEKLNLVKSSIDLLHEEYRFKNEQRTVYNVEWHKKFSLPFACIVLFMIGAPLGSIIRKGGLGMPLVIAVIFFLIYHLLNMFGEKLARSETLTPFVGVWLPSLVLLPVGFYLTYKAMHDSQLFNKESYYRAFRKFKKMVSRADA